MARVTIRVECDGGSTTEITETSIAAVYGGPQAALLVQEAFVRTCRSLGVADRDEPTPDSTAAAGTTEPAPTQLDRKAA